MEEVDPEIAITYGKGIGNKPKVDSIEKSESALEILRKYGGSIMGFRNTSGATERVNTEEQYHGDQRDDG